MKSLEAFSDRTEQGRGADALQRPLVPRFRFQPRLTPGVRHRSDLLRFVPEKGEHHG